MKEFFKKVQSGPRNLGPNILGPSILGSNILGPNTWFFPNINTENVAYFLQSLPLLSTFYLNFNIFCLCFLNEFYHFLIVHFIWTLPFSVYALYMNFNIFCFSYLSEFYHSLFMLFIRILLFSIYAFYLNFTIFCWCFLSKFYGFVPLFSSKFYKSHFVNLTSFLPMLKKSTEISHLWVWKKKLSVSEHCLSIPQI